MVRLCFSPLSHFWRQTSNGENKLGSKKEEECQDGGGLVLLSDPTARKKYTIIWFYLFSRKLDLPMPVNLTDTCSLSLYEQYHCNWGVERGEGDQSSTGPLAEGGSIWIAFPHIIIRSFQGESFVWRELTKPYS